MRKTTHAARSGSKDTSREGFPQLGETRPEPGESTPPLNYRDVQGITYAIGKGLGSTAADHVAAAWIVGEYVGATPPLGDYRRIFGTVMSPTVTGATISSRSLSVDEARNVSDKYGRYERLGEVLAPLQGFLDGFSRLLFDPRYVHPADRPALQDRLEHIRATWAERNHT